VPSTVHWRPTTTGDPLPLATHYHWRPTTTGDPLPRTTHYHGRPTTTDDPLPRTLPSIRQNSYLGRHRSGETPAGSNLDSPNPASSPQFAPVRPGSPYFGPVPVWRLFGACLAPVWRLFGACLAPVWRMDWAGGWRCTWQTAGWLRQLVTHCPNYACPSSSSQFPELCLSQFAFACPSSRSSSSSVVCGRWMAPYVHHRTWCGSPQVGCDSSSRTARTMPVPVRVPWYVVGGWHRTCRTWWWMALYVAVRRLAATARHALPELCLPQFELPVPRTMPVPVRASSRSAGWLRQLVTHCPNYACPNSSSVAVRRLAATARHAPPELCLSQFAFPELCLPQFEFRGMWSVDGTVRGAGPNPASSPQFAPVRPGSPRFAPIRPDSPRFAPIRPDSPRFAPIRPSSPQFALVRPHFGPDPVWHLFGGWIGPVAQTVPSTTDGAIHRSLTPHYHRRCHPPFTDAPLPQTVPSTTDGAIHRSLTPHYHRRCHPPFTDAPLPQTVPSTVH